MVNYCPFNIHKLTSGFRPRLGMLQARVVHKLVT